VHTGCQTLVGPSQDATISSTASTRKRPTQIQDLQAGKAWQNLAQGNSTVVRNDIPTQVELFQSGVVFQRRRQGDCPGVANVVTSQLQDAQGRTCLLL
jgi:hypothetical protein